MDNNQVPQPLFAPASQNGQNDYFDLNEVFAEYFINEFDDPLNAYTGGMANYSGGVAAINMSQDHPLGSATVPQTANTGKTSLPTGGIRTVFHTGPAVPPRVMKKIKIDETEASSAAPTPLNVMLNQQQQAMGMGIGMAPQMLQAGRFVQPQVATSALPAPVGTATQATTYVQSGVHGVALPVGVGIRLGGIGGVVPAQPGTQYSHNIMWAPNNNDDDGIEMGMSEQAIAERRQRNREHAKRSRVRKKFMLESMQEQVRALQRENNSLRMLVQEHIPEHAMQIISDCCTENPLFGEGVVNGGPTQPVTSAGGEKTGSLVRSDFSLMQSLAAGQKCFVLSDPKLPDNPIVFATPDFYKLTGYTSKEVLGRNCRFLQGPGTDKRAVDVIRTAVATGSDASVCLLNYKADGTPFWNQFFIAALRDSDNNVVNYVGVQTEVEPEVAGSSYLEDKVNAVLPLQNKDDRSE